MPLNSMSFLVFFVAGATFYFALPSRRRWAFLLAASYVFCMLWDIRYGVLLAVSTAVDYVCAIQIAAGGSSVRRKVFLLASLFANLGLLFTFKYFSFLNDSLRVVLARMDVSLHLPTLRLLLPVGVSFYTFQKISYVVDVYRGRVEPERHLGRFALYVAFFPKLVAGPIERAENLLPQLQREVRFDPDRVVRGVELFFWGLFKKVVVADRLGIYVASVYDNVSNHDGLSYIVATYFFTVQIYCDFSGYTDMAIGCAKVLGIELMQNFNRPYFSTTMTEFWRRWHISLSTWLRDYLYISMGGNRRGRARLYFNLFVTMLLGGIWHGANWTFVIWGTFHGLVLIGSRVTLPVRDRLVARLKIPARVVRCVRVLVTFNLAALGWLFFRANSVHDAFHMLRHLFRNWPNLFVEPNVMLNGVMGVVVVFLVDVLATRGSIQETVNRWPIPARWAVYCAVAFSIVLFGVDGGAEFIYFQF